MIDDDNEPELLSTVTHTFTLETPSGTVTGRAEGLADPDDAIVIPIGKHQGKTLPEVLNTDERYGNALFNYFFWANTDEERIAAVQRAEAELPAIN